MFSLFYLFGVGKIVACQALLGKQGMQNGNVTGNIHGRILEDRIQQLFKGQIQSVQCGVDLLFGSADGIALNGLPVHIA